ncbi:MAG: preprotein translocase subunit SecA [Candidatus Vogelbacteria bacterium]|nr:preprotein translocase subunit SecA [Candidatus Vogelbacteria bacterium]
MLDGLTKLFGDGTGAYLKATRRTVEKINSLEHEFEKKTDDELKNISHIFKEKLVNGLTLDDILPEAFAAVREAAKRTIKQRHYDVQLIGGITMHEGKIAEMRTGEGKTLVATLPAYLNALSGKGVHVVTVNDYLSRRDTVWMGQIYNALGLTNAVINHESSFIYDPKHVSQSEEKELDEKRDELGSFKVVYEFLRPCTRREAYEADITYGTNNEFGFDYLRDHLVYHEKNLSQRDYNFAIVDEVDSILIDESRTPLIISSPFADAETLYQKFSQIAEQLNQDEHYEVDEKLRAVTLKETGIDRAESLLGVDNIYTEKGIKYVHHLETAIRAKALFERDREYVVKDGEIIIVDESTGRLQPGRRWSEGLHQAIESKEGVKVQQESRTLASISFQNYFRPYAKLAGMTGTAYTSKEEFFKVYELDVIPVPPNKTSGRKDENDFIFQTEMGKFKAVARQIKELNAKGQPVLVGTVSIEKNELLSAFLNKEGIKHEILNAKNHEREGEIIAQAGRKGSVVIATNMAGRGVDILLGGAPYDKEAADEVRSLGGLAVIGTERHEARRIDNQLRGRSGRQGDPGSTQFFVSLEDSLMRVFASDMVKNMMGKLGIPEDEPIQNRMVSKALESAQEKIEGFNFDSRKHLLEYDDVLNHHRRSIYTKRQDLLKADLDGLIDFVDQVSGGDEKMKIMIEEKRKLLGDETFRDILRQLILQLIDLYWMEHLEAMEYMRGSVRLRAYGQRDPLVEYKREGLRLFKNLEEDINNEILRLIPTIGAVQFAQAEQKGEAIHLEPNSLSKESNGSGADKRNIRPAAIKHLNKDGSEIGRNDLCYCGSGKKYKKCHGR